jgi:hypothetical protein
VVGVDGLPSEKVAGMGRPKSRDATFYLTWRRTVAGSAVANSVIRGLVIGGQAGQTVTLRLANGRPRQTTLDSAGKYTFGDLPAGTYTVEVGGASVANLRVDGRSSIDAPAIDLRPRQSLIKGAVVQATGQPSAGSKVTLTSADARREAVTDSRGRYEFGSLPPGDYTLETGGLIQTARVNGRDQVTVDFRLPADASRKPIAQYLLFGSPQQVGTRANLLLAEDYMLKAMPAAGFSVDEAMHAATVIIVGDVQAVSAADEERLKTAGCQVTRLGGGPYAIEQAFSELIKGKGVSPVPGERLRGPGLAADRDP